MTRKDYIAIADAFSSVDNQDSEESYKTWWALRERIMNVFKGDNHRFNADKFREATEEGRPRWTS